MGTDFNYDDTSHQIIFDHINGGAGSAALQDVCGAWQRLGDDVGATGKSYVQSAIRTILATRKGAAAEAAAEAIGAMLPWMDNVAQVASAAAQRAQGQAEHWVTAKNSVPPVPAVPQSAGFFSDPTEWAAQKMDWLPGLITDEEKAQQRQQDAAEQARQAMRVYQSNSNGNVDLAPAFTAPQALDGSVGALPLSDPRVDAAGAAPPPMAGVGAPVQLMSAHQTGASPPPAPQPPAHQPATYQAAATVAQLADGGSAGTAGSAPPPGRLAGTPTSSQGITPVVPLGTGFNDGTAGRARMAAAHGRAGGTYGAGRSGVSRDAGFGPRPTSTSFGPRPAASAHPAIEEMSGARGAAGSPVATRGAGGGGYVEPLGGGGVGGQRGEQDREHRTKYLLPNDSNSIVGDLPPTAPPVIGADY